jgi:hypothetical protein
MAQIRPFRRTALRSPGTGRFACADADRVVVLRQARKADIQKMFFVGQRQFARKAVPTVRLEIPAAVFNSSGVLADHAPNEDGSPSGLFGILQG